MKNKTIAFSLGISCHLLFFAAIVLMAGMFFFGLTKGILPLGHYGRWINILLLIQFPLIHSYLLSKEGRKLLEWPFPSAIAKDLFSTAFTLISSLQLIIVFIFWTPSREVWYVPTGNLFVLWSTVYIGSWILLIVSLYEGGLAMHTGLLGWLAVLQSQKPKYPKLPQRGLHSLCRHPIYLSFALIILTAPVWSLDHLNVALIWVAYCLIGPLFKERRQKKIFGQEYALFKNQTPYILPVLLPVTVKLLRSYNAANNIRHKRND